MAQANINYEKDKACLTLQKEKYAIPLVKSSTKCSTVNSIKLEIFTPDITEIADKPKQFISRSCETKLLEPLLGQVLRLALPEYDWPKEIHIESCEPKKGVYFDSQVLKIQKHKPNKNSKHSKYCNSSQCILACPMTSYSFALAFVYNSTTSNVQIETNLKLAPVEPIWDQPKLGKMLNKSINTIFADIQKVKLGVENEHEKHDMVFKKSEAKPQLNYPYKAVKLGGSNATANYLELDPINNKHDYIKECVQRHNPKLNLEERSKLVQDLIKTKFSDIHPMAKKYLTKYPEVVHLDKIPFIGCRTIKHRILYRGPVFYNKQYRCPNVMEEQILEEVDRLIREGLIEPSDSPFSNCYLPVVKYDEKANKYKIRLCLDMRRLNTGIEIDRLHIGDTQELLNKLSGAKYLTVLDASSGYLQVDLEDSSKKYTAFRVGNRAFQWRKMCFGLGGAPSSWSRLMQVTLSGLSNVYVYMDDILIFSQTMEEHEQTLDNVFKRLSFHGIELELKKCKFISSEVEYLGFTFTSNGLKPQSKRVKALLDSPLPKTLTEARSLISAFSFYRRFIQNFSKIAYPLIQLTKGHKGKGTRVTVFPDKECEKALESLKNIIQNDVCLKYPDFSRAFTITTDASLRGLGATLSQKDAQGRQKPLAFASRTLSKSELNYPIVELECLGLVFALKTFRHIILGYEVELVTDHLPLVYLFRHADPSSRLYRYQLAILEFNIIGIKHIAGQDNHVSDYLSRWSFKDDENLGPVVSYALTSPLASSLPPKFKCKESDSLGKLNTNSLVIFTADARNCKYLDYVKELKPYYNVIDKFYANRVPIASNFPVAKKDTCPTLGQVITKKCKNVSYVMFVTNLIEKPQIFSERKVFQELIQNNQTLKDENFKFAIRNDQSHIRDYYFMVCLEKFLEKHNLSQISEVHILWPKVLKESSKRISNVSNCVNQFEYRLWQENIECTIVGKPEIDYNEKDAIMAALQIEAKASIEQPFKFELEKVKLAQERDPILNEIILDFNKGVNTNQYCIIEGILYKLEVTESRGLIKKLYIPQSLVPSVLQIYHDMDIHPGYIRTLLNCKSQVFWKGMGKDIREYISKCITCIQTKHSNNKQVIPGKLKIPPHAGHTYAIDIVGSLPKSGVYYKILVVVCTFSRYVVAAPLVTGTASEVIKRLEEFFDILGHPEGIVSDRAGAFTGLEFEGYLGQYIIHHLTTPYSPRSNALAERSIRSILSVLRVLCNDRPKNWHIYLRKVCVALNSGFNTSTKERPYFMFFGRDPAPRYEILRDQTPGCDASEAFQISRYAHELALKELEKSQSDRMVIPERVTHYTVGDVVYLQNRFVGDKAYKIKTSFDGPYRVTDIAGNTVQLKSLTSGKCKRASMRDLKLFKGNTLTKTNNKNVDKPFPIYQNTEWDVDLDNECKLSEQNLCLDNNKYNLRPRHK